MRLCHKQLLALIVLTATASPVAAQTDSLEPGICVTVVPHAVALTSDGVLGMQLGSSGDPQERFSFSRFEAINGTDRCFGAATTIQMRETCVNFLAETSPSRSVLPIATQDGSPGMDCNGEKSMVAKLAKKNRELRRQLRRLQKR